MKDDTSLMLNNVSRYPLPVLPSNLCVGFRLVLRIMIKLRLLYVQLSTFLLGILMASLIAVDLMARDSVDVLAHVSWTGNVLMEIWHALVYVDIVEHAVSDDFCLGSQLFIPGN